MFGILVFTKVRQDPTGSMFCQNLTGDLTHNSHDLSQSFLTPHAKIHERWNMLLGDHDDMDGPEGSRVVKGQYVLRLHNHVGRGTPAQHPVAIEVIACISVFVHIGPN